MCGVSFLSAYNSGFRLLCVWVYRVSLLSHWRQRWSLFVMLFECVGFTLFFCYLQTTVAFVCCSFGCLGFHCFLIESSSGLCLYCFWVFGVHSLFYLQTQWLSFVMLLGDRVSLLSHWRQQWSLFVLLFGVAWWFSFPMPMRFYRIKRIWESVAECMSPRMLN